MLKVKHERTADCVVAGFRRHKDGEGVGSLLLGLFDDEGDAAPCRRAPPSFTAARRRELVDEIAPAARATRSTATPGARGPTPPAHERRAACRAA